MPKLKVTAKLEEEILENGNIIVIQISHIINLHTNYDSNISNKCTYRGPLLTTKDFPYNILLYSRAEHFMTKGNIFTSDAKCF